MGIEIEAHCNSYLVGREEKKRCLYCVISNSKERRRRVASQSKLTGSRFQREPKAFGDALSLKRSRLFHFSIYKVSKLNGRRQIGLPQEEYKRTRTGL